MATTYYVASAANGGSDSNSGLTTLLPWLTVAKVNGATFAAGDSVLFNRGDTWREQGQFPSSGTSGHPITIGAYGSGPLPQFLGSELATTWAASGTGDFLVTTGNDDGFLSTGGGFNQSGNYVGLGAWGGPDSITWYSRFSGVTIPQGATITAAHLALISFENDAGTTVNVNIKGIKENDPAQFASTVDGQTRARTAAVAWNNIGAWTTGGAVSSPDISAVIQEVVNQPGYAGSHLTIVMDDNGSTAGKLRASIPYDTDPTKSAVLHVEWTMAANVWQSTVTTQPLEVYFNGTRGTPVASAALCTSDKKWFWAADTLYTYGAVSPNTTYPSQIEVPKRLFGWYNAAQSHLIFDSLDCRYANNSGLLAAFSLTVDLLDITVQNCNGQSNAHNGIWVQTGLPSAGFDVDGVLLTHNTASYNSQVGIYVDAAAPDEIRNITVSYNTTHHNCLDESILETGGLHFWGEGLGNCIIEYNTSYSNKPVSAVNTGHGIHVVYPGILTAPIVRFNVCYDNQTGIWLDEQTNAVCHHNVCYGNIWFGLLAENLMHGNLIAHNVVYNSNVGIQVDSYAATAGAITNNLVKNNIATGNAGGNLVCYNGGENDGTNGSGNVYEYNCFGPQAAGFIKWGGVNKDTYAAFATAYGSATHSVTADPLFVNAAAAAFTLQRGSPAIDAGVFIAGINDGFFGSAPDMGAFEYNPNADDAAIVAALLFAGAF